MSSVTGGGGGGRQFFRCHRWVSIQSGSGRVSSVIQLVVIGDRLPQPVELSSCPALQQGPQLASQRVAQRNLVLRAYEKFLVPKDVTAFNATCRLVREVLIDVNLRKWAVLEVRPVYTFDHRDRFEALFKRFRSLEFLCKFKLSTAPNGRGSRRKHSRLLFMVA